MDEIFVLSVETCIHGEKVINKYPHKSEKGAIRHLNSEYDIIKPYINSDEEEKKETMIYIKNKHGDYVYITINKVKLFD